MSKQVVLSKLTEYQRVYTEAVDKIKALEDSTEYTEEYRAANAYEVAEKASARLADMREEMREALEETGEELARRDAERLGEISDILRDACVLAENGIIDEGTAKSYGTLFKDSNSALKVFRAALIMGGKANYTTYVPVPEEAPETVCGKLAAKVAILPGVTRDTAKETGGLGRAAIYYAGIAFEELKTEIENAL